MKQFRHEFWWKMEKLAGRIWERYCPENEASYWLDFLPAFCTRKRYQAQNDLNGI